MTKRHKFASICAGLLALVGILFPSSIDGAISWELGLAFRALIFVLAVALFVAAPCWERLLKNNIYICPTLLLFTFLSPLSARAYGLLILYASATLLLSTDFSAVPSSAMLTVSWAVINYGSLVLAAAIVFNVDVANSFVIANYSAFYPWLVEGSVNVGKPILTFGSHSIAGFFFAMFCVLNFIRARATGSIPPMLAAGLHLVACALLRSVTGYMVLFAFSAIALFVIRRAWLGPFLIILGLMLVVTLLFGQVMLHDSLRAASETLSSEGNGFLGRYTSHGRAGPVVEYIAKNPFRPSGVGYAEDVWVGDSGFLEYWFRGSLVLIVLMYRGLWLAVRSAVIGQPARRCIFMLLLMFEIGYTNLVSPRMLGFIPLFFIVFTTWQLRQPRARRNRARSVSEGQRTKGPNSIQCLP